MHSYQKDKLLGIKLSTKSRISEFVFQDNKAGKVLGYEIDSEQKDGDHPRSTASEQDFRIEGKTIIFSDINLEIIVRIDKLTEDELVLRFDDGETSKFKKL